MKKIIVLIALMAARIPVGFSAASELTAQATFLSSADISTLLKRMPSGASTDQPLRIIDGGAANVGIFVVRRPQEPDEGCTIEHDTLVNDKTTSIFLVLEGAGTIVTGGKLVQPAPVRSNDPDLKLLGSGSRGSGIQNGQSRRITAGDVVIIPPSVPHGFSAIEKSITYQVVRIDSGKVLPLKSSSAAQARGISPFACDRLALSPEIQKRHFDVVGPELLKLRKSVRELEDGYDFEFPVDEKTFQLLSEWAMQERLCCPFLDISLRFEREGGPLWLRLAGRKGVKEFIKIEMAQGGIKL